MYSIKEGLELTLELLTTFNRYNYNAYKDILTLQVYLADNHIDMFYTDTLSHSELEFLFNTTVEYIKLKNEKGSAT